MRGKVGEIRKRVHSQIVQSCFLFFSDQKGNDLLKESNIRKTVPFSTWCKKKPICIRLFLTPSIIIYFILKQRSLRVNQYSKPPITETCLQVSCHLRSELTHSPPLVFSAVILQEMVTHPQIYCTRFYTAEIFGILLGRFLLCRFPAPLVQYWAGCRPPNSKS